MVYPNLVYRRNCVAGIVSGLFQSKEEMMEATFNLANQIAQKSPVAVQGTKVTLNYARNHSVEEALDYIVSVL